MNIYKAPNLIISPKRKVYRRGWGYTEGGGHSMMNPSTHTHIHILSSSPLFLLPPPPHYTHASITVSEREGSWDGKRCVFRADLKANVELE